MFCNGLLLPHLCQEKVTYRLLLCTQFRYSWQQVEKSHTPNCNFLLWLRPQWSQFQWFLGFKKFISCHVADCWLGCKLYLTCPYWSTTTHTQTHTRGRQKQRSRDGGCQANMIYTRLKTLLANATYMHISRHTHTPLLPSWAWLTLWAPLIYVLPRRALLHFASVAITLTIGRALCDSNLPDPRGTLTLECIFSSSAAKWTKTSWRQLSKPPESIQGIAQLATSSYSRAVFGKVAILIRWAPLVSPTAPNLWIERFAENMKVRGANKDATNPLGEHSLF